MILERILCFLFFFIYTGNYTTMHAEEKALGGPREDILHSSMKKRKRLKTVRDWQSHGAVYSCPLRSSLPRQLEATLRV